MQSSTTERRRTPRRKTLQSQEEVIVRLDGSDPAIRPLVATVKDISESGIGIESPTPLTLGSRVSITGIVVTGITRKKLEAEPARVAHCRECSATSYMIGLEFVRHGERTAPHGAASSPDLSDPDYYDVLQLSPKADPDTIHRVYRMLAQRYHPDNAETGNHEQFRLLLEAYRVLSDPEKRASYDATLGRARQLRWKIFDQPAAAVGKEAEKRKRSGVLSLLYAKRANQPEKPTMTVHEFEELLGCPKEHLEFTLWYLREAACLARGDNGRYTITAKGVETVELEPSQSVPEERLLPAVK